MKRTLLTFILATMAIVGYAQKLVIGSRVPEFQGIEWQGSTPDASKATFIEFYQSTNASSVRNIDRLGELRKVNPSINIVILVQEKNATIDKLVTDYGSKYSIGYDPQGKMFEALGVKYVPFSMALDAKEKLLWQGNSANMSEEVMKNIK